ncbi:DNA topoisomerase 6 subunit B-like [Oceanobacillus picturae]|uniref:DNA topoisomerase 6 subunit B-like n=1 Tax=Oceanobacillus picturae TaxID=171693 RepID=A0A0U9H8Z1_9BACI|nr:AbiV family abortive infection protein [Oceanobacillus picturae]GAQ19143.1 DNA topoisomerase 6 subunit B-like [Oceanobacillus picturae]
MNFNQLKVEEIEKIFFKIYENGCELLEEAEFLHKHQRYARSYLCAHIAFEEFGKLPMLYSAAINVYNGNKTDWKKLNRRIRDHKRKVSQSYGTIMFYNNVMSQYKEKNNNQDKHTSFDIPNEINYIEVIKEYIENEVDFNPFEFEQYIKNLDIEEEIKEKYSMTMLLNEYKNGSLYSDFDEGEFIKPSEKIDRTICEYGITLAYIQKKYLNVPNLHKEGLYLYKITKENEENIKTLQAKYIDKKKE